MPALVRDPETNVLVFAGGGDIGTPERASHGVRVHKRGVGVYGGGLIREGLVAEAESAGLLDSLRAEGWLMGPIDAGIPTDEAIEEMSPTPRQKADMRHRIEALKARREAVLDSRLKAAYWVAALYHKAGIAQSQVSSYSPLSTGGGEMSDHEAWNRSCYHDMWKEIGAKHANLLQSVICFDQVPQGLTRKALRDALDAVAKWRGF